MAKVTDSQIVERAIFCVGESKFEFIRMDNTVNSGDYVVTNLVHPLAAFVTCDDQLGGSSASIDTAQENGKAIIFRKAALGADVSLLVVGR